MSSPEIPQDNLSPLATVTAAYGDVLAYNREHTGYTGELE